MPQMPRFYKYLIAYLVTMLAATLILKWALEPLTEGN